MATSVFFLKMDRRNAGYAKKVNRMKKQKGYMEYALEELTDWYIWAKSWLDKHHTCRKAIKYIGVTTLISLAGIYSTNPANLLDVNVWITAIMVPVVLIAHNYLKHLQENDILFKLKM